MYIWRGSWYKTKESTGPGGETLLSTDKIASYTYEWKDSERYDDGYIADKFRNDGLYFITDAPFPCEEPVDVEKESPALDPAPGVTMKVVSKDYVDERVNGYRYLTIDGSKLPLRPYCCHYRFSDDIVWTLDITSELLTEANRKNKLHFYLTFPSISQLSSDLPITVDGGAGRYAENVKDALKNRILLAKGGGSPSLEVEMVAFYDDSGKFTVMPADDFYMAQVPVRSAFGDIVDRSYTITPTQGVDTSGDPTVGVNILESTLKKRLTFSGNWLYVESASSPETVERTGTFLTVPSNSHAEEIGSWVKTYKFSPGITHYRDSGEDNMNTMFFYGGTSECTTTRLDLSLGMLKLRPGTPEPTVISKPFLMVTDEKFEDRWDDLSFSEEGGTKRLKLEKKRRDCTFGVTTGIEPDSPANLSSNHPDCWEIVESRVIDLNQSMGKEVVFVKDNENLEFTRYDLRYHLNQTIYLDLTETFAGSSAVLPVYMNYNGVEDAGGREYIWRLYIKGDSIDRKVKISGVNEDGAIMEGKPSWVDGTTFDGETVKAGKLYCFEFTKMPGDIFIGRVLYSCPL